MLHSLIFTTFLFGATPESFASSPRANASVPIAACDARLSNELSVPKGWGFAKDEYLTIASASPELLLEMILYARLARFLDEDNEEFFALVGSYAHLGFVHEFLRTKDKTVETERQHRRLMVQEVSALAARFGLYPADLDPAQLNFIADALGDLPFASEVTPEFYARDTPEWKSAVETFVEAHPVPLRDLTLHSRTAQSVLIESLTRAPHDEHAALVDLFRRRLSGARGDEASIETVVLDHVEQMLRGEFPSLESIDEGSKQKTRLMRKKLKRELELSYVTDCLSLIFRRITAHFDHNVHDPRYANSMKHPFEMMTGFIMLTREGDLWEDRNLSEYLRHAFATLVLRRPVMTGAEINQTIRKALKVKFDHIRTEWRKDLKASRRVQSDFVSNPHSVSVFGTPQSELTTREERLRTYVKKTAGEDVSLETTVEDSSPPEAASVAPEDPDQVFWRRLTDPNLSLDEARALVAAEIHPDQVYTVPIGLRGLRYRVRFSPALLDQILNPSVKEPQDPRAWFGPMLQGQARKWGQAGWKKYSIPQLGRYRWEIKPLHSDYRLLGLQENDGVWRYELIALMHR